MKRVYCISVDDLFDYLVENGLPGNTSIDNISDEDYMKACKKYGWDLSLDEFVYQFNNDLDLAPTTAYHYIKIF